jgi:CxxC motif-containing protein (DUF1111 family)
MRTLTSESSIRMAHSVPDWNDIRHSQETKPSLRVPDGSRNDRLSQDKTPDTILRFCERYCEHYALCSRREYCTRRAR